MDRQVFRQADQVDDDGDVDVSGFGLRSDAVDLMVVAVEEGDPSTRVGRVASFCFAEDFSDNGGGGGVVPLSEAF